MDETAKVSFTVEKENEKLKTQKQNISIPNSTLVEFDPKSDIIRGELVQIIVQWLVEQGLTSSAQLLCDEAAALFRQEHNERKTLRDISHAVQEGNWETAHGKLKRLESLITPEGGVNREAPSHAAPLIRSLPFLLAQQQFLEYVDEDDGQRAHHFFMRRIKPLEGTINKDHFQQLVYLLTCRTVSEAGASFPAWRGWTPTKGRLQLQSFIAKAIGQCSISPYCRQYKYSLDDEPNVGFKSLKQILANSLSYELLQSQHPSLVTGLPIHPIYSIWGPMGKQLLPSNLIMTLDVNELGSHALPLCETGIRLTACQPFLQAPAVAVGTNAGTILWIPLKGNEEDTSLESHGVCIPLYKHATYVRGMSSHEHRLLLSWSGHHAVVLSVVQLTSSTTTIHEEQDYVTGSVANTFTHTSEVRSACLFPCGSVLATGLSNGVVTKWNLETGAQMSQHAFSGSSIESLTVSRSGSCYFAASREGLVRVVDASTGVLLFTFAHLITSEISSIAISPSSSLLLVSHRTGTLRLWDILTGEPLPQRLEGLEATRSRCRSVTFGAVDSHIITGHDNGCLYFWDTGRAKLRRGETPLSPSAPAGGSLDPSRRESSAVYSPNDPGKYCWPVGEPVPPQTSLRLHRSQVTDVKFQHNYVVTSGDDGRICICVSVRKDTERTT
uniref:Uncharacterized protein n=1 Tax=Trypanosoma congolense (strain IL3000) TaxID=1068625 RepID=G0UQL4_TRYCI|nr:conserved hypothetical protein [Trypanosoma congolense IL3000]